MNKIGFVILLILALGIALYPLRKQKIAIFAFAPILTCLVIFAYGHWGAWNNWQAYLQQESKQRQIQAVLQSLRSPQELINKLRSRLDDKPESARGWYLLGRVYASQNQWQEARDAFAKAHHMQPDNEQNTVNYAQSLWEVNQHQLDNTSRELFKTILVKNPNQPDSLAMLAMDAYMSHDYQLAINYWQHLLTLAPSESEDAKAIRKAIAKAQQNLS